RRTARWLRSRACRPASGRAFPSTWLVLPQLERIREGGHARRGLGHDQTAHLVRTAAVVIDRRLHQFSLLRRSLMIRDPPLFVDDGESRRAEILHALGHHRIAGP